VLPNLEDAPLFRIIGRKKVYGQGIEKAYLCSEDEKDNWANLFEYKGSGENVRLRFSLDALDAGLTNCAVIYKNHTDKEAWDQFVSDLKKDWEAKTVPEKTVGIPEKAVGKEKSREILWRRLAPAGIIVLIVVAVGLLSWNVYLRQSQRVEPASVDRMAYPLPEKPSIAVLPFKNLSGDPEQEYFSDGLTEEIITTLSKTPKLFVIARNSTFTYKDKPVKVQQVSEELGVRYVLEGSVRMSKDQIRITAQLIDALTGHHLWAERYDRKFEDIFAIQDEITMKILAGLQVKLTEGERMTSFAMKTKNIDAYLKALKSNEYFIRHTRENNIRSRQLAQEVIDLDPEYFLGWLLLAHTHLMDVHIGWTDSPKESIEKAVELTYKAEEIAGEEMYHVWAWISWLDRQYDKAISKMKKAIAGDHNNDLFHMHLGQILVFGGRPQDGIVAIQRAMRLNPFYPTWYLCILAEAYELTDRYNEAIEAYEGVLRRGDYDNCAHIGLATTYIYVGREEQAKAHAQELLKRYPESSFLNWYRQYGEYSDQAVLNRKVEALRKAGLN
jgi:adenylate cyclase